MKTPRSGLRLAQLRIDRKMSRVQLCNLAGFHRNYLARLERGEYPISDSAMVSLARGLKLTVERLEAELTNSARG